MNKRLVYAAMGAVLVMTAFFMLGPKPGSTATPTYCPTTGCVITGQVSQVGGITQQLPPGTNVAGTLQNSVTALGLFGGSIRLPATYSETITTTVAVSNPSVKILCDKGAQLISSGATVLINATGANFELGGCAISGATQVTISAGGAAPNIHDNTFVNAGNNTPGSGIAAAVDLENSANDAQVINNSFTGGGTGAGTDSAVIVSNYTTNQANNGTARVHVRNNRITGNNAAFAIMLFNVSDSDVVGNVIDQNNILGVANNASGYGIMGYNTTSATGSVNRLVITGNNVANTAGTGIYCQGCEYPNISDNILTNTCQQQLDTLLTVGAIGIAAGNTASPTSSGVMVTGNVIHTSGKSGIELSHTTAANVIGNTMDDIAKNGIWVTGNVDTNPTIIGNTILPRNAATSAGVMIINTPDALVAANYIQGPYGFGIEADANSPRAAILNNVVRHPVNAGSTLIFAIGAQGNVSGNQVYVDLGVPGVRIGSANSRAVGNYVVSAATAASPVFINSTCSACVVDNNTVFFASGTGTGIVEQAGATNDVFRRNIVVGGSSPGWNLAGTTPTQYENSFNGATSPTQVTSLTIAGNTVLPATMTGSQGNGVLVSTATGPFTNGNLRSTNAGGADTDSGLIVNRMTTQMVACGTTTTCGNGIPTAPRVVFGQAALTGGTATVTGISPAFTSTTTSICACSDLSGTPSACQALPASTTSITLKGTGTDTISYVCAGN